MAAKKDSGGAKASKNIRTGRSSLVYKYKGDAVELALVHTSDRGKLKVARNSSTKEVIVENGDFVLWSGVMGAS